MVQQRSPSLATVVFSLYAGFIPLSRLLIGDASSSANIWRALLIFLVLCAVGKRITRVPLSPLFLSALGVFPLAAVLSGMNSSLSASLTVGVEMALLVGLGPFVLGYYAAHLPRFTLWVCGTFVACQSASAAVGLLQLTGATPFGTEAIFGRSVGLAGHPNVLGLMSTLAVIACFVALGKAPRPARAVILCLMVLNLTALVLSGSLSAMLGFVMAVAVYALARGRTLAVLMIAAPAALGVAALSAIVTTSPDLLLEPVFSRLDVVLGQSEIDGGAASIGTRMLTYEWAWSHIQANPLAGVGFDAMYAGTYNGYTPVHNVILHAWYRGGIFLFLWQVLFFLGTLVYLAESIARRASAAPAAAVAALMVFAHLSAFFTQPQYWLPLLFAIVLLPRPERSPALYERPRIPRTTRRTDEGNELTFVKARSSEITDSGPDVADGGSDR